MNRVLLSIWIGLWVAVAAQAQTPQDQPPAQTPDMAEEAAAPGEDAGGGNDAVAEEEPVAGAAETVEETLPPEPPDELERAEEEFQPDEEISEDYPVPLPSDI